MRHLILVVLIALLGICCGRQNRPLNVMIIAVDTLRPDHLGCYGYDADTSPRIDALAGAGTLLENAISQAPWTHPSFATLFSSLYPSQHNATTYATRMGTSFPTLAGILSDHGYATCAIVNAPSFAPELRLGRGFREYDVTNPWEERLANEITSTAIEWIDGHTDEPFFIFVHYFDPHLSYSPPAPYDTIFDPTYHGPMRRAFNLDSLSSVAQPQSRAIELLSASQRKHIESLYDGEIAFADREIGRLLDGLRASGLHERTLVLFLSDHGEEFFDHGGLDHGHSLYDELLHVPLIASLPGTIPEDARISDYVRLLDIAPTILDFLGIEPAPTFEGSSLKPLILGTGAVRHYEHQLLEPHVCYSEALRQGNTTKAITAYPWKLIHDTQTNRGMLFNVKHDRAEQENLLTNETDRRAELEEMLLRTVFDVSDTWFIEMGSDSSGNVFSLELTTTSSTWPNRLTAARLLDAERNLLPVRGGIPAKDSSYRTLRIVDLPVEDRSVLAFKLELPYNPIQFDLAIDGTPSTERTFMGRSMLKPSLMPFTTKAQRSDSALIAEPEGRPRPPYFVIWNQIGPFPSEVAIKLDEATEKRLRALGYIQ